MILNLLINFFVLVVGSIFNIFPTVSTLPTVAGYDIDSALVNGMGAFNTFTVAFWPIYVMFQGFLVLMSYYGIKMLARLFLGHRAPGKH